MTQRAKPATKRAKSAPRLMTPDDEGIVAITPEKDGWYWLYDHRRDSVYLMLFRDRIWHDVQFEGMELKEVIEGPVPYPTQAEIDGQNAHFEKFRYEEWPRCGFDPAWNRGEPRVSKTGVATPLAPMMDGYFWIQFVDKEFHEIVSAREGTLYAQELDGPYWEYADPDLAPRILFGPLIPPDRFSVKSRNPERARLARANMPWLQGEEATSC